MHVVVDPGTAPNLGPLLTITNDVIGSMTLPLARAATTGFARNVSGYQPPEGNQQFASGDERRIVGERTIDVILEAPTRPEVHAALNTLTTILHGPGGYTLTYDGTTWEVTNGRGVTAWQQIGDGKTLRVTIAYYPKYQHGELELDGTWVLGPL